MIMVNITHFRPESEAAAIMAPLLALKPIKKIKKEIAWENMTDATEALSKPGGQKALISCGLQKFEAKKFKKCLDTWMELVEEYPNAKGSFFMFNWLSTEVMRGVKGSAFTHRDCPVWW